MKCLKCDGELHPILKDGQSYAQCDKCGRLFTRHDLKYSTPTPQPQSSRPAEPEPDDDEYYTMGLPTTILGWILCALFLMFGLFSQSAIPLIAFIVAAVLISPVFRNRVYLSGKVWIPLVVVLAVAGLATYPQLDTQPKKVTQKQEAPTPAPKRSKAAVTEQDEEDTEEQQAAKEREEAERAAKEQAEQERIAQEQAAAQAEQERIAQEQAAAQAEQQRLEQERIAQEQAAAAQAEQERIAREQAEQQRIAQEQAAAVQANAGQNPFNIYNNPEQQQTTSNYVLNTNTKKFHYPHCNDVKRIAPHNYSEFNGTREDAIDQGYSSCGHCNP